MQSDLHSNMYADTQLSIRIQTYILKHADMKNRRSAKQAAVLANLRDLRRNLTERLLPKQEQTCGLQPDSCE